VANFVSMRDGGQNPTPFGIFDQEPRFASTADRMVTYVKRKLGDDVLSVELTKKQIFACFEEATLEYSAMINKYQAKSQLATFLGQSTGSLGDDGYPIMSGSEEKFPRESLEFLNRFAEPYAVEASLGGSYESISGSIALEQGRQDYNLLTELKKGDGTTVFDGQGARKTKMKIMEVFHFNPTAAYRFFDTTSAINYLNNEFSFESFTPETIFYVLPAYEDLLRGGQLKFSQKLRRSNVSYQVMGNRIRIYPTPTQDDPKHLFMRVVYVTDPLHPPFQDDSIHGVSNMSNLPFGVIPYSRINSIGHQWIKDYAMALAKELLGLIRSKFSSVPIPNTELQLNGSDLISSGKEEKEKLLTELKELLESMTYDKLMESSIARAEAVQRQLKLVPIPHGKTITMG